MRTGMDKASGLKAGKWIAKKSLSEMTCEGKIETGNPAQNFIVGHTVASRNCANLVA